MCVRVSAWPKTDAYTILFLQPPSLSSPACPGVAAPAAKENGTITHTHTYTLACAHPLYLCWLIVTRQTRRFAFMRFINRGQATINSLLNSLTILNSFSPVTGTSVTAGSGRGVYVFVCRRRQSLSL